MELTDIQEFYITMFLNKKFVFETNFGRLVIKFDESNFCHLIGLHYYDRKLKGFQGWELIKKKKITLKEIKKSNKNVFNNTINNRIQVLYKIIDIFQDTKEIKRFKRIDNSKFECDLFMYNKDKNIFYIISFILDNSTKSFFAPESCLLFYKSDLSSIKYLGPDCYVLIVDKYSCTENFSHIINNINLEDFDIRNNINN